MYLNYSRGCDLPPLMRDSLLADETAAAAFGALAAPSQQKVIESCYGMTSKAQIDEFIRQTDNFMVTDLCARGEDTSLM